MKWRERLFYLFVGAAAGFFFPHLVQLNFKYDFDVLGVASVIAGVLVAYFVQGVLLQRYKDLRAEKRILIEKADDALRLAKQGRKLFLESFAAGAVSAENQRALIDLVRDFANELAFLQECADDCKLKVGKEELRNTRDGLSEYRLRLTGGGFPATPYSLATRVAVERVYKDLRKNLQRFVLKVNRM